MKKIKVKLTFVEPVLGTWPSNQNIAREFIASKSPDAATVEDEVAALGADAVLIGRLQVYALSVAGALGVAHMLRLLREELELCMALAGCRSLSDVRNTELERLHT